MAEHVQQVIGIVGTGKSCNAVLTENGLILISAVRIWIFQMKVVVFSIAIKHYAGSIIWPAMWWVMKIQEFPALTQAAAADQWGNKAGLPYRLWRFAAIHHCRGSFPKIIHSRPFIFRSLFIHEWGNDVSPRSLFSLSPYFSALPGRAGHFFSASAKAHSIKQSRHS